MRIFPKFIFSRETITRTTGGFWGKIEYIDYNTLRIDPLAGWIGVVMADEKYYEVNKSLINLIFGGM